MARVARKLYIEDGLFAVPKPKLGKTLDAGVAAMIREFYQIDEHSRQLSGKKDSVSVSMDFHVQKRLILCNFKELYEAFKMKLPIAKVGVSRCSGHPFRLCVYHTPNFRFDVGSDKNPP
jgi:hypothetical protein